MGSASAAITMSSAKLRFSVLVAVSDILLDQLTINASQAYLHWHPSSAACSCWPAEECWRSWWSANCRLTDKLWGWFRSRRTERYWLLKHRYYSMQLIIGYHIVGVGRAVGNWWSDCLPLGSSASLRSHCKRKQCVWINVVLAIGLCLVGATTRSHGALKSAQREWRPRPQRRLTPSTTRRSFRCLYFVTRFELSLASNYTTNENCFDSIQSQSAIIVLSLDPMCAHKCTVEIWLVLVARDDRRWSVVSFSGVSCEHYIRRQTVFKCQPIRKNR